MSRKYAVFLLPFFVISTTITAPFIVNSFVIKDYNQALHSEIAAPELLALNCPTLNFSAQTRGVKKPKIIKVLITAYSSSVDETDDTPFITASGSYVRHGVVAANFLSFGTKIRMPEIFGGQIFTVEDRLHKSYNDRIDIWFPSKGEAWNFGIQFSEIEIL